MTSDIETPSCPRCGNPYAVRILTPAHALELATQRRGKSFNPFDLFSSHYPSLNDSGVRVFDLVGGCLFAVVMILTSPLQNRFAERKNKEREQRNEATRGQYKQILDGCPTLYTCHREHIVFLPGYGRGIPTRQVITLLNRNVEPNVLMDWVQRGR